MTESERAAAAVPAALLAAEGHELAFCHGADDGGAPCAGLAAGRRCPLSEGGVDLVVDVRPAPGRLTLREAGVLCALRSRVPLLVAGPTPEDTALGEAATICRADELVDACACAMAATGPAARRAVSEAIRPLFREDADRPHVRLMELEGTVHLYISLLSESDGPLLEEVRRRAWLAYIQATRGRYEAVAHVAIMSKT
uniref:Uncharacterized protein n=1 Tax=Nonomuraea gerenzanensis TaxID=93944 RepID=A0A1M4EN53_9ACTN|nr:hypothetical protein BN4615_P9519 [Nonomuraea gerenzanensis]